MMAENCTKFNESYYQRQRGLSLVEMLLSLAITAMLLTATMVAIDTSFRAYASAAESASTQAATRMVINRLLMMVRNSTAHGPLTLSNARQIDPTAQINNQTITCTYLEMLDSKGRLVRIEYKANEKQLYVRVDENGNFSFESSEINEPLLGGVTEAKFHVKHRVDNNGVLVLERGSLDLAVMPDQDNTLSLENAEKSIIRVIASTMPRRVEK